MRELELTTCLECPESLQVPSPERPLRPAGAAAALRAPDVGAGAETVRYVVPALVGAPSAAAAESTNNVAVQTEVSRCKPVELITQPP